MVVETDLAACVHSIPVLRCSISLSSGFNETAFRDHINGSFPQTKETKAELSADTLIGFRPVKGYYTADEERFCWIQNEGEYSQVNLQSEAEEYNWESFLKLHEMLVSACTETLEGDQIPLTITHEVMHRFQFANYQTGQEFTDFGNLFSCFPRAPKVIKDNHLNLWNGNLSLSYVDPGEELVITARGPYTTMQLCGTVDIALKGQRGGKYKSSVKTSVEELKSYVDSVMDEIITEELKNLIQSESGNN